MLGTIREQEFRAITRRIKRTKAGKLFRGYAVKGAYLERGHALFEEGEPCRHLFVLGRGRVRLLRRHPIRELTVGYVQRGGLVGEEGLLQPLHAATAMACDAIEYLRMDIADLPANMSRKAPLFREALAVTARRARLLEDRLHTIYTHTGRARLSKFLLRSADLHGRRHARGTRIQVRYTHAEIGAYVGLSRETVTLLLGDLRRAGALSSQGRNLIIVSRKQLEALWESAALKASLR